MAAILSGSQCVNSSPSSDTYMGHWLGQQWFRYLMACRLCGAKPLPKPMITSQGTEFNNKNLKTNYQNSHIFIDKIACHLFSTKPLSEAMLV